MSNETFYEMFFPPDFWANMDRTTFVQDDNSMFGDPAIFQLLIERIRPNDIVEVGSWKGHSANFMADTCKSLDLNTKIVCVDTFLGGPEHWLMPTAYPTLYRQNGRPHILERFLGNVAARGNDGLIFPFAISSTAGADVLNYMDFRADLVFIDASHGYDDVVRDIKGFWRIVADDGIMFGDDYQAKEVADAVHDCANQLGVHVFVIDRKWMYLKNAQIGPFVFERAQLRTGYEGWVHP